MARRHGRWISEIECEVIRQSCAVDLVSQIIENMNAGFRKLAAQIDVASCLFGIYCYVEVTTETLQLVLAQARPAQSQRGKEVYSSPLQVYYLAFQQVDPYLKPVQGLQERGSNLSSPCCIRFDIV